MTPEAVHLVIGHGHDGDDRGAVVLVGDLLHSGQHVVVGDQDVAEQHVERLVARLLGSAVHGVTQAQRLVLIHVADVKVAACSTASAYLSLPRSRSMDTSSGFGEKCSSMDFFSRLFTMTTSSAGRRQALFHDVLDDGTVHDEKHFLGWAFVAGRKREPRPAAGMIAFI